MMIELESERLRLLEISWEDIHHIHELYSYPEVDQYNTLGIPANIEETEKLLYAMIKSQQAEVRKLYSWKIVRKDTGSFIGMAGMSFSLNRFRLAEISYELLPSQWGNGYATETAKALIKVGFETFGLHKVEAGVATENIRSVRVLENAGMTREGLRRKILPIRGEWKDNYLYAIVEDDPRNY